MQNSIHKHAVVTQDEWLKARKELLEAEKALTHQNDQVTKMRMELPWVKVNKTYEFDTAEGKMSLKDLFCGNSQLLIYHFMYGPEYEAGCPTCSSIADGFNGFIPHLINHDVMFAVVSRAPLQTLLKYQKRMGWIFFWASSFQSDFNYDFNVSFTEEDQRNGNIHHNYRSGNVSSRNEKVEAADQIPEAGERLAATTGVDWLTYIREAPGMSAFALMDREVYHTYSAYERGFDALWGMYQWLDRAPLGRNEEDGTKWFRRHDEYDDRKSSGGCCS
ncbi:MAG: DUF899 domain-containing protein [Mucilaginibacter sp.]|nr:DUF899 domain-containing protein [Mucilaginibacter sp.]